MKAARRAVLLAALFAAANGCAPDRPPAPIGAQDLGASFSPAGRAAAGDRTMFSACDEAEGARDVVSSWFDIVSHIDACDVGKARYYAGAEFQAQIADRLDALGSVEGPACRAQVRTTLARIRAANAQVQEWIPLAVKVCSLDAQRRDLDRSGAAFNRQTGDLRCRIRNEFPELRRGGCL